MMNQQLKFKRFRFENLQGLDPVTLYVEQHLNGAMQVTCTSGYFLAWQGSFKAPGYDSILYLADMDNHTISFMLAVDRVFFGAIWSAVQPLLRAYCETTTAENRWDCTYEK